MNDPRQSTNTKHQLSYSPAPTKGTLKRQNSDDHSPHSERAPLNRQDSDISLYDQKSSLSDFFDADRKNIDNITPWTRKQWEALERWYVKRDRDCQQATDAFFVYESVTSESGPPLWSKNYILWRCRCLDTNTKYHHGVLPSERKRLKDKLMNMAKQHDLLKPKRGIQQQRKTQQQQQQQQQRQQRQRH